MKDNSKDSSSLRGTILDGCIIYERIIDDFICQYFGANEYKRNQLKEFIFSTEKITFDSKRQIFLGLVSVIFPDFKKEHPKFDKKLQELVSLRNLLAHSELVRDVNERENENDISYIKYRGGKRIVETFNWDKMLLITNDMNYIGQTLTNCYIRLFEIKT